MGDIEKSNEKNKCNIAKRKYRRKEIKVRSQKKVESIYIVAADQRSVSLPLGVILVVSPIPQTPNSDAEIPFLSQAALNLFGGSVTKKGYRDVSIKIGKTQVRDTHFLHK